VEEEEETRREGRRRDGRRYRIGGARPEIMDSGVQSAHSPIGIRGWDLHLAHIYSEKLIGLNGLSESKSTSDC
jgi:hypothetical protein